MKLNSHTNPAGSARLHILKLNCLRKLIALALILGGSFVHAGSHTWSGATSGLWSVPGNWSAGGAPVNGESPLNLTFPVAATRFNSTNDVTGLQVDSLTLAGGYTIYAQAGKTLTLKGTATNVINNGFNTFDGSLNLILSNTNFINVVSSQLTIYGPLSGSGSLGKVGAGSLSFYGPPANTYAGSTYMLGGSMVLQRGASSNSPAICIPGPLIMGNSTNSGGIVYVQTGYPEQIADNAPVTIGHDGTLSLDAPETLGSISLYDGQISGTGPLIMHGDIAANANGFSSYISCPVSLGGTTRTFNVTNGNYDLYINGSTFDGGASAGIVKIGNGQMQLVASNSYTGITVVKDGVLELSSGWALGSTAGGTLVTNSGVIRFFGGFAVGAEPLTLASTGLGKFCLYADVATNSWAGPVTLAVDTGIDTFTSQCLFTFHGSISGPGSFFKEGNGTAIFAGSTANTYAGTTYVEVGKLVLSKTNVVAVAGPLSIGDGVGGTSADVVQLARPDQIADNCAVTITNSGLLDLMNNNETIGSLAGGGYVSMLFNTLTTGGNNASTTFEGGIGGVGFVPLIKNGTGTFTLNGTNTCTGTAFVNGGKLVVNGPLSASVMLNGQATLGGNGSLGNAGTASGHLAPGNSPGKLKMATLSLTNASSSLDVEINGAVAGTGYDQVAVNGAVNLLNPALNITMLSPGAIGNKYMIITNDGSADLVNGTFNNLAEGAIFTNNGTVFQITYKGGNGNDVELTQLNLYAPLWFGGIQKLGNSQMQVNGSGLPNTSYDIQANADLATTNWTKIGTVAADASGVISFTDTNAPGFPQRYYRFTAP